MSLLIHFNYTHCTIVCLGMGYLDALMQEQGLLPLGESA